MVLVAAGLTGCATSKNLVRLDPVGLVGEMTGLVVDADLQVGEVAVKQSGCDLVFAESGRRRQYSVHLEYGSNQVIVDPPAGEYTWIELACPNGKTWTFQEMRNPTFRVWKDKLTYVGRLLLRKDDKGGASTLVRRMDPPKDPKKLEPASKEAELVSGFSQVRITPDMLMLKRVQSVTLEYYRSSGKADPSKEIKPDYFNVDACNDAELAKNPVVFGKLEFKAKYADGKFVELADWKNESTYSESYLTCVKDAVKGFKPALKIQVAYKTIL